MYSQTEVMVAFLFVFTVLRTAVNSDFVYSSMSSIDYQVVCSL